MKNIGTLFYRVFYFVNKKKYEEKMILYYIKCICIVNELLLYILYIKNNEKKLDFFQLKKNTFFY